MSVTVDHELLEADSLGLRTVGQVLTHLQKDNRLVVQVLIDGQQPDLADVSTFRQHPLSGHTLYIETTDSAQLALEVLEGVQSQFAEADRLRSEASTLLYDHQTSQALARLSGCFTTWKHAQESVLKVGQLMHLDLDSIKLEDRSLADVFNEFADQLREIKNALENRDFVLLNDILTYETTQTSQRWHAALEALRKCIAAGV